MREARTVRIRVGDRSVEVRLADNETADRLWEALPFSSVARTWGDEVYFPAPLDVPEAADARADVDVGEVGFWPPGRALCIFFGPTPASDGPRPRAASPVNVCGRVVGDAGALRGVRPGAEVRVERVGGGPEG